MSIRGTDNIGLFGSVVGGVGIGVGISLLVIGGLAVSPNVSPSAIGLLASGGAIMIPGVAGLAVGLRAGCLHDFVEKIKRKTASDLKNSNSDL